MAISVGTVGKLFWKIAAEHAAHDRDEQNARDHAEWVQNKRHESRELILNVLDRKCGITVEAPSFFLMPDDELHYFIDLDDVRLVAHERRDGIVNHLHIITEPCPRCGYMKLSNEITSLADLGDALLNPPTLDGHQAYDPETDTSSPCTE